MMVLKEREGLVELLRLAADEMLARGETPILSDFETCAALGSFIREAAAQVQAGDDRSSTRLWDIFAPTCEWDDARGSQDVANAIFKIIDLVWRPNRGGER
ncbi:MAG: hypothetical protein ABFD92_05660 [Planctomycetaceae bacterium]|nr:hypothetical protein [Planctomycetaceae bacterium]